MFSIEFDNSEGSNKFLDNMEQLDDRVLSEAIIRSEPWFSAKFSSDVIVQGQFSLKYLLFFIKATHLDDTVNILLSNDQPLVLEYHIAKLGSLKFLLVPNAVAATN